MTNKIKTFSSKTWNVIKRIHAFFDRHGWLQCIVIGIVLNLAIESFSRHSLIGGVLHLINSPIVFLFNSLIITTVLSICTLFKFKYQLMLFFIALFLAFGITNCVLLTMRVTPFEWVDLQIVKLSLIFLYITPLEFIFYIALIGSALTFIVIFFVKGPRSKVNYIKNGVSSVAFAVVLISSLFIFRSNGILLSDHVKNLANAYKDYGFNYCFMCSMLDLGIDKPSQYDEDDIGKIVSNINNAAEEKKHNDSTEENPNIVFVQLESFFDVNHLSNIKFSSNPIPNFTKLQKEYSSGYLSVPSIGAGTANTEFEIISGLSLEYFGVGEYPYKTILKKNTSESMCYNLEQLGYKSHAIHNNEAVFYDRNIVFQNLGFDTFTSIEYMNKAELTPNGWAKDDVLLPAIVDALDSTEASDLVYTITVQSHGKYPSTYNPDSEIKVLGAYDEETRNKMEYYVNQLQEVDVFIGDLLHILSERNEKTVVVLFGDHLPAFDITENDLANGDLYQTEYVIWDNFGLEKQDGSYYSYQLASHVFGKLGIDDGLLNKLHQNFIGHKNYSKWLEVLQYDMLYGEKYAWHGQENYPYKTKVTQMGVKEVSISDVESDADGNIIIKGTNFTDYSSVFINNRKQKTEKIDEDTLIITDTRLAAGDRIEVSQVDRENTRLSSSKIYLIGGTEESPTLSVDSNEIIYKPYGLKISTVVAIVMVSLAIIAVAILLIVIIKHRNKKT